MQLKSFWLRRCVRSSAMNVLSAYRRRRSAAASRSPPVNRWHLRQTNAGIMGVLTQNTLVWGTRKPPNLGIHFPRKTANRQWINRPNHLWPATHVLHPVHLSRVQPAAPPPSGLKWQNGWGVMGSCICLQGHFYRGITKNSHFCN